MANFPLLWSTLIDGQPVMAANLRTLAEYVQKCANFDGGSSHELDGTIEISGATAEIDLTDGATLKANGHGHIIVSGSDSSLIANLSSVVSLEVAGTGAKVEFGANKYPELTSRQLTRPCVGSWNIEVGNWTFGNGIWTSSGTGCQIACEDRIESSATLNVVTVYLDGPAHGTNWPPQYKNHLTVYKKSMATGALTLLGEADDPNSQANYEMQHSFYVGSLAATFSESETLYVRITTEHGTDAVSGTVVTGLKATSTFADMRPV